MYCLFIKYKDEWILFTNEIFKTKKDAEDYAKQNKFKKSIEWKVEPFNFKYFRK